MNLPNKLTLIRIILVPFYLAAMLMNFSAHFLVAAGVFIVASITDFLDGKIARKTNQVTVFGKLCDPLADKMLTTAALLAFMQMKICSIWVVMIVLSREFLVTSFRLVASSQGVIIPAGILGKIKTASQMAFSIIIMLGCHFHIEEGAAGALSFTTPVFATVSGILLWITALLTVISGVKYIIDGVKVIDFTK